MAEINSQGSSFYDAAWAEWNDMIRFSPAPRLRRERLLSWLKQYQCSSLLDVGCGNGEFLLQAHKALPSISLAGADISPAVIDSNARMLPGIDFFTLDLNVESLPRRFDVVTCMEVIEHCDDYRMTIMRLAEMTEKVLLITVPCGPVFEIDRRVGHSRHFSADEISEAMSSAGFKVTKIQCWGFPFFNLYKWLINRWPDKMCKSFLSSTQYTTSQKFVGLFVYLLFRCSLPFGGYQLFAVAHRNI